MRAGRRKREYGLEEQECNTDARMKELLVDLPFISRLQIAQGASHEIQSQQSKRQGLAALAFSFVI
jgi:hypothetical protein